jgi:uncharacterized membrane protein
MHVPDLSPPPMTPPLTPWWAWLALASITAGAILAAVVFSRQSGHIAANRETAAEVEAIHSELSAVKADVTEVRRVADALRSRVDSNQRQIERIEVKEGGEGDAP